MYAQKPSDDSNANNRSPVCLYLSPYAKSRTASVSTFPFVTDYRWARWSAEVSTVAELLAVNPFLIARVR
jgi:hypothetical protein